MVKVLERMLKPLLFSCVTDSWWFSVKGRESLFYWENVGKELNSYKTHSKFKFNLKTSKDPERLTE